MLIPAGRASYSGCKMVAAHVLSDRKTAIAPGSVIRDENKRVLAAINCAGEFAHVDLATLIRTRAPALLESSRLVSAAPGFGLFDPRRQHQYYRNIFKSPTTRRSTTRSAAEIPSQARTSLPVSTRIHRHTTERLPTLHRSPGRPRHGSPTDHLKTEVARSTIFASPQPSPPIGPERLRSTSRFPRDSLQRSYQTRRPLHLQPRTDWETACHPGVGHGRHHRSQARLVCETTRRLP